MYFLVEGTKPWHGTLIVRGLFDTRVKPGLEHKGMSKVFGAMKLLAAAGCVALAVLSSGCKSSESTSPSVPSNANDPARCVAVDLGEASDIIPSGMAIPDNQLVKIQGITSPRSLVWQDAASKKVYYVAKIMGTGERLLYSEELAPGQEPRILSDFEGTIHLWSHLPKEDGPPMAKALEKEWGVKLDVDHTYLVQGGTKPAGCP